MNSTSRNDGLDMLPMLLDFIREKDSGLITQHLTQACNMLSRPLNDTPAEAASRRMLKTFAGLHNDLKGLWYRKGKAAPPTGRGRQHQRNEPTTPSTKQVHQLLSAYHPLTWFLMVLTILQQTRPGILPPNIDNPSSASLSLPDKKLKRLLATVPEVLWLQKLPIQVYTAFSSFCSFMYDSIPIMLRYRVCMLVSQVLVFGKQYAVTRSYTPSPQSQTNNVLEFYVSNCHHIFPQLPGRGGNLIPNGYRFNLTKMRQYHPNLYGGIKTESLLTLERKIGLREFFLEVDRKYVPLVELMFESESFHTICLSVLKQFCCLPQVWKYEVHYLHRKATQGGFRRNKFDEWAWFGDQVSFKAGKRAGYCPPDAVRHFRHLRDMNKGYSAPSGLISNIINEFVEFQRAFSFSLQYFIRQFVNEVEMLSGKKIGRDAYDALGFSMISFKIAFGKQLVRLMRSATAFSAQLEIIRMLPVFEKSSKILIFCKVLQENMVELTQSFAWYNAELNNGIQVLQGVVDRPDTRSRHTNLSLLQIYQEFQKAVGQGASVIQATPIPKSYYALLHRDMLTVLKAGLYHFPKFNVFVERIGKELQKVKKSGESVDKKLLEAEIKEVNDTLLMYKDALSIVDNAIRMNTEEKTSTLSSPSVQPRRRGFIRKQHSSPVPSSSFSNSSFFSRKS